MLLISSYSDDKVEEVVFREYGLMKRLLGEASSGGVSDVSGLAKIKKDQHLCEDMFYAVYHDGTVRAWNAEVGIQRSLIIECKDVTQCSTKS